MHRADRLARFRSGGSKKALRTDSARGCHRAGLTHLEQSCRRWRPAGWTRQHKNAIACQCAMQVGERCPADPPEGARARGRLDAERHLGRPALVPIRSGHRAGMRRKDLASTHVSVYKRCTPGGHFSRHSRGYFSEPIAFRLMPFTPLWALDASRRARLERSRSGLAQTADFVMARGQS
jgi:hypothetical protein